MQHSLDDLGLASTDGAWGGWWRRAARFRLPQKFWHIQSSGMTRGSAKDKAPEWIEACVISAVIGEILAADA